MYSELLFFFSFLFTNFYLSNKFQQEFLIFLSKGDNILSFDRTLKRRSTGKIFGEKKECKTRIKRKTYTNTHAHRKKTKIKATNNKQKKNPIKK